MQFYFWEARAQVQMQSAVEITQGMVSMSGISEARDMGFTCLAVRN